MKPILFSTPMVQAILDGRKTQTRRVVKINGQPISSPEERLELTEDGLIYHSVNSMSGYYKLSYQPSDILWVRETWAYISDWTEVDPAVGLFDGFIYKADWQDCEEHPRWRPAIFMPREAARIFLRVTDVRAERLQDITNIDAMKEGVSIENWTKRGGYDGADSIHWRESFAELWNSINAKRGYSWDTNPWVWVIEFERCEKPDDICSTDGEVSR